MISFVIQLKDKDSGLPLTPDKLDAIPVAIGGTQKIPVMSIIQLDNGAIIVPANTPMTHRGNGYYAQTTLDDIPTKKYSGPYNFSVDGVPFDSIMYETSIAANQSWTYSNEDNFKNRFGINNTNKATNIDKTGSNPIYLQRAGIAGDAYINRAFRAMGYQMPLQISDQITIDSFTEISNRCARWHLAEARIFFYLPAGSNDSKSAAYIALSDKKYVDDFLANAKLGLAGLVIDSPKTGEDTGSAITNIDVEYQDARRNRRSCWWQ